MSGERIEVAIHCTGCDGSGMSPITEAAHCEACQGDGFWTADLAPDSLDEAKMRVGLATIEMEAARDEYTAVITEEQYDAALARKAKAKGELADAFLLYRRALTKGETDG